MKKFFGTIATLLAVCFLFCLAACERAEDMSSLKDISHPYAGMYKCEKISIGGRDLTDRFQKLSLELKGDGNFLISYLTAEGSEGGYGGTYQIDEERKEITFSGKEGARQRAFTFPYEKGAVRIDYNLFGNLLHAEFRMPS